MPKVTFIIDGEETVIEFESGALPYSNHGKPESFLDLAKNYQVPLEHACGGSCACTTCHVIIRQGAQVYYWPLEKRERNAHGKPGKLHAKVAVIDDQAVLSSANLTDDAFNRNFELGSLLAGDQILQRLRGHFEGLCADGTLKLWEDPKSQKVRSTL